MSVSQQITPASVKVGDQIKFKTIHIKDTTIYSGKVVGIADFATARIYGDVAATHLAMSQGLSQHDSSKTLLDVTKQTFLIVKCYDGVTRPFAFEWLITEDDIYGYVSVIEIGAIYSIRLYDVSADEASIAMEFLKSKGYTCKLTKASN